MLWSEISERCCDLKINQSGANLPPNDSFPWWTQVGWPGNLSSYWDVPCESFRSYSSCPERTFLPHLDTELVIKKGVGTHYICMHFFLLFCSLTPQIVESAGQTWVNLSRERKEASEFPSKAFRLCGMSERGEWKCKSWGSQSTFALMLCRADGVCGEHGHLLMSLWQDPTLYLRCIFPPSAFQGGFV